MRASWICVRCKTSVSSDEATYIVAAVAEPYFCFEAATEAEAVNLAKRALAFWTQTHVQARVSRLN